eukprot:3696723-Heterocapsa_arctica.AAC.1
MFALVGRPGASAGVPVPWLPVGVSAPVTVGVASCPGLPLDLALFGVRWEREVDLRGPVVRRMASSPWNRSSSVYSAPGAQSSADSSSSGIASHWARCSPLGSKTESMPLRGAQLRLLSLLSLSSK